MVTEFSLAVFRCTVLRKSTSVIVTEFNLAVFRCTVLRKSTSVIVGGARVRQETVIVDYSLFYFVSWILLLSNPDQQLVNGCFYLNIFHFTRAKVKRKGKRSTELGKSTPKQNGLNQNFLRKCRLFVIEEQLRTS